MQDLVQTCAE